MTQPHLSPTDDEQAKKAVDADQNHRWRMQQYFNELHKCIRAANFLGPGGVIRWNLLPHGDDPFRRFG